MVIALKNDDLELQFKTFGGELSSIRSKEGIEYLWQGDPEYWSGQAPVLFPICGSVRNGQVQYHLKDGVRQASFQDTVLFARESLNSKNRQTIVLSLKLPLTTKAYKIIPTIFEWKSLMN